MATSKSSASKASPGLSAIKKRLSENKLTASDIKQLGKIVANVEKAARDLRAAVVE